MSVQPIPRRSDSCSPATRFALLSYFESENLGDEIQSIAAARFLPPTAAIVDRDHLRQYAGQPGIAVILNGWFLVGGEWPPAPAIHPLLVSFYTPPESRAVYDRRHVEWYRRHEPIGCRSTTVRDSFEALGVAAYFSGCLSLCLPPSDATQRSEICVVDCHPQLLHRLVPARVLERAEFLTHVEKSDGRRLWRRARRRAYRTLYGHCPRFAWSMLGAYRQLRHQERMAQARGLLDRYARARLVITSRLHCFLPCLALGTPVLLLRSASEDHRFAGLAELGRSCGPDDTRISIDWDNPEPNPDHHRPLANALAERCRSWRAAVATAGGDGSSA